MTRTLLLLAAVGCVPADPSEPSSPAPPREGIAVGNPPGMAAMRAATAPADGIAFTALEWQVGGVYVENCEGEGRTTDRGGLLELDGGTVQVPAGRWCAIGLVSDAVMYLDGQVRNGGRFRFHAAIGRLMLYGDIDVPAAEDTATTDQVTRDLVLELGEPEWVDERDLALQPTDDVAFGDACLDDPLCTAIWTGIVHRSAVYGDDGDGVVSETERATGDEGRGDERRD